MAALPLLRALTLAAALVPMLPKPLGECTVAPLGEESLALTKVNENKGVEASVDYKEGSLPGPSAGSFGGCHIYIYIYIYIYCQCHRTL